jgi:DNA mismatch repair protein MutS
VLSADDRSWIRATGLRHPIVEAVSEDTDYVPNDVSVGGSSMLLYGINAGGKSTTMKAVGLAVLMAQSGMFVACERLELSPFGSLFTRIGMRDDIYRGHSTFMVEMLELRNILRRCDGRSLVLGDEICAGTESLSALSIVGAGVVRLASLGASFMFATHLHELLDVPEVRALREAGEVKVCHVSTSCDADGDLVYDRKIRPGPGTALYGLEVCRSIGMADDFMRAADAIRRRAAGVPAAIASKRTSRYNAAVIVDRCASCGAPATETHHIRHRVSADAEGFVEGRIKVNAKSNLVPLCAACHDATHDGTAEIVGYVRTTGGVKIKQKVASIL